MAAKNPSSVMFWNDLENDEQLKTCSLAAKGLWDHHMLPIAARSAEPGVIVLGKHPSRIDDDLPILLARACGEGADVIGRLLRELVDSGAASVDGSGRVYNRRMVREEAIRKARSEAGKRGADATNEKRQKAGKHPSKDDGNNGGNASGKVDVKPIGKNSAEGQTQSLSGTVTIASATASVGRQNIDTIDGKDSGGEHVERHGETAHSSLLHASTSNDLDVVEAAACDAAREPVEPPKAAAAEDDLAIPGFLRRTPDGPQAPMADRALVDEAFALWTPLAYELGISDIGYLNAPRRAALAERLAEIGGIEGWKVFLEKVRVAQFLRKPDGRPKFWVGLGKLLEPEHFSKILEDRYADEHARDNGKQSNLSTNLQALAEFGREGTG